ncbi:MAG: protoheme IX farnesyltransferase [Magnetococcales bacterium]|nr:protoheme IX farnesyltransferase [Magnetococcales bacterium]MBF0150184.1 protoheme IX farnesyltransferase [Magnetococcales bacterium]MBF0173454.1 protoheme IX farnesyltransferase [Magnetococcales bacterium]MBF0348125.1 protoheme IX farnesyltransferase [Magnetococcales bacterium]
MLNSYLELLKLRIGGMIALTAIVAYLAMSREVSLGHMVWLIVVMLLGSSSSAVFNHWYDRDIDRRMERTSRRPLATGALAHPSHALWLAGILLLVGVVLAVWLFNPVVGIHLFLGAFFYGVVYTVWLKRRSWLNIVLGGLAGSFAVLAGAASVKPELCALPLSLAVVLFFWTPSHFWSLAIFLREEYQKVGVPMLPVVVGAQRTSLFIFVNTLFLVAASILAWWFSTLGLVYLLGALLAGGLFLYGNWRLMREPSREMGWRNFIGSMRYLGILFLAIVLDVHI